VAGALLCVLSAHLLLVFPANVLGLVAGFACYFRGLGRCGTAREGFLTGSLFGLLLAAGSLYWLGDVLYVLTPVERLVGVLVVGGFLLLVALPYGLWGLGAHLVARRAPRLGLLLQAPGLLLTQALIHDAGLGFPWLHHGYWLASGPLRAWLGLLGAWASGLLVLHLAASLGHWKQAPRAPAHALVTLAVLGLGALVPLRAPAVPGSRPLQAAVIAIPPATREDSQQDDLELLARYVAASRKTHAELLLWPESVIRDGEATLGPLGAMLGLPGRKVFAGALLPAPEGRYNTLVEVQSGQPVHYKQQRVPFSEYVPGAPLRRLFGALRLNTLKTDVRTWEKPQPDLQVDGVRLIPLICYESAFAGQVRPGEEPTVLLHVGNESWFRSGLMHRMSLAQSMARASEHGLPLMRATAGGSSGFYDPAAEPPWTDAGSSHPEVSQHATLQPRRAATLYSWLRRNEPF
jgi:apolipoprotein N-acyltransferase